MSELQVYVFYSTAKNYNIVLRKSAISGAPYKSAKARGWALFGVFPYLTMKECPCHIYSDSTSNSCEITLECLSTSGSNGFETFETQRIHVKLPSSACLLVVRTHSKPSKHIEFM